MVKFQPSTLAMWVRFPLPAPSCNPCPTPAMRILTALSFACLTLTVPALQAQSGSACDDIARDVAAAIQKDPSKTLMIVEDALVINESCACEIVRAAIAAAQADSAMVNQIVQTGIAVAPKMSGVIMDCASAASPDSNITNSAAQQASYDPTTSAKNPDKNPLPVAPVEEEFIPTPSIRGVYLIQPPASGFVPYDYRRRRIGTNPTSGTLLTP